MHDGTHLKLDFSFTAEGEVFDNLYYLVDGIYPALAQFLRTITDPKSKIASFFARQEVYRKDVERGFVVLKIK